jgi:hypothetical protein
LLVILTIWVILTIQVIPYNYGINNIVSSPSLNDNFNISFFL